MVAYEGVDRRSAQGEGQEEEQEHIRIRIRTSKSPASDLFWNDDWALVCKQAVCT
ncbi:hypothetical protein JCM10914A_12070 [Paenibacillus sp. JCM 10914]